MNGLHPDGRSRLAEMLRLYRNVNDLDTRAVAKQIGMSAPTLNRIERGHDMDATSLIKVLNWLMTRG